MLQNPHRHFSPASTPNNARRLRKPMTCRAAHDLERRPVDDKKGAPRSVNPGAKGGEGGRRKRISSAPRLPPATHVKSDKDVPAKVVDKGDSNNVDRPMSIKVDKATSAKPDRATSSPGPTASLSPSLLSRTAPSAGRSARGKRNSGALKSDRAASSPGPQPLTWQQELLGSQPSRHSSSPRDELTFGPLATAPLPRTPTPGRAGGRRRAGSVGSHTQSSRGNGSIFSMDDVPNSSSSPVHSQSRPRHGGHGSVFAMDDVFNSPLSSTHSTQQPRTRKGGHSSISTMDDVFNSSSSPTRPHAHPHSRRGGSRTPPPFTDQQSDRFTGARSAPGEGGAGPLSAAALASKAYAGPGFQNSPPPASLPIPRFGKAAPRTRESTASASASGTSGDEDDEFCGRRQREVSPLAFGPTRNERTVSGGLGASNGRPQSVTIESLLEKLGVSTGASLGDASPHKALTATRGSQVDKVSA